MTTSKYENHYILLEAFTTKIPIFNFHFKGQNICKNSEELIFFVLF